MSMDYQPRSSDDEPAEYNRQLETFQSCFADKLESVIRDLPLPGGARVLDAPCGSGFYTRLLARRVGVTGEVHGADLSPALLEDAVERRRPRDRHGAVHVLVELLELVAKAAGRCHLRHRVDGLDGSDGRDGSVVVVDGRVGHGG